MEKTWRTKEETRRAAHESVRAMLDILSDLNHDLATATPQQIDQAARMVRSWSRTLGDLSYELQAAEPTPPADVFDKIFPNGGKIL